MREVSVDTGLTYLLRIKVFLSISTLLEEFARSMAKEFVVSDLKFESSAIPCVVKVDVVRMNERQLLILKKGA